MAGLVGLVVAMPVLFALVRPPTPDEVERDIWIDWVRFATDAQGRTLADQLVENHRSAGQQMIDSLGRLIASDGERFVVRTQVAAIRVRDRAGGIFAHWELPVDEVTGTGWKTLSLEIEHPIEGPVGHVEVAYRFYGGGLESLPHIRRLLRVHSAGLWLVGFLALAVAMGLVVNRLRLRERAGRLENQRLMLDLAHQMCHELRNGLWAFALEGKNVRELFQIIDDYCRIEPEVLEGAALRTGFSPEQAARLVRRVHQSLAEHHLEPGTDIAAANDLARQSQGQIENFSRYISLTVEELDRHLLGSAEQWENESVSVREAWDEACGLLAMRLKAAGVSVTTDLPGGDDEVRSDRRALVHVFVNLIKNAVEALREQPGPRWIRWECRGADGRLEIAVRNNGPAIPAELAPRLFESSFSTKRGTGRGTGLRLVRRTIDRLQGTIRVESDDRETTFHLVLPVGEPAAAAGLRPSAP